MSEWDPDQYLRFADARLRPALELLSRVGAEEPATVIDAGCGPGNVLPHLARRWPRARLVGVDSSPEMLTAAEAANPGVQLIEADLASWQPDAHVDVLYSNAVFHWLDDHRSLFSRLMGHVAPDGWLTVQMPRNHGAPTHTSISDILEEGAWADRLRPLERRSPVADPAVYHEVLTPHASSVDIWQTEYLQMLRGEDAVVEWARGSVLRPLLAGLDDSERAAFLDAYRSRMAAAYPPSPDGTTLLPFRRLFIVARRS